MTSLIDQNDSHLMLNFLGQNESFTLQTFDDSAQRNKALAKVYNGNLNQCFSELLRLNEQGAGVFVTVNQTDGKGRKKENIVRVRALYVDFDKFNMERTGDLVNLDLPPNMVIESSKGKHHAYWVLGKNSDIPLEQFTALQKRLIAYFINDGADKGIHDLPRVMRLAGFKHQKGEAFTTRVDHLERRHYTAEQVINFVQSLPIQEIEKKEKPIAHEAQPTLNTFSIIPLSYEQAKLHANGRWHEIFSKLGYVLPTSQCEHTPCPMCGGKDRFRFDNQGGNGTFICGQGAGQETIGGDGFDLLVHGGMSKAQALQAVNDVLASMGLIQPSKAKDTNTWQAVIPLSKSISKATPFPIQDLPIIVREASEAIAEYVQAPIAMAVMCVLGTLSHLAQAEVNAPKPVDLNGQGEPCSLFLITEGGSGSRKSSCKDIADRVLKDIDFKRNQSYQDELQTWKKIFSSKKAKTDKQEFLASNPPPQDPRTLFNDITFESLAGLYIDGVVRDGSINTDEAAQFFGGHSMKGDTANSVLGGFTKLFDDGFVQRQRSKSNENGSGSAYGVRLTFNLQGQREILNSELKDPIKREQGFLPRFLFTAPDSLAGERQQSASFREQSKHVYKDARLIRYWERCKELANVDGIPRILDDTGMIDVFKRRAIQFDTEAYQIDLDFYNECESNQAKGKPYESIKPFASRASQLARRLATVLAYFEGEQYITAHIMQSACSLLRHSLAEWIRYADLETNETTPSQKLWEWLAKQKDFKIMRSKLQTSAPIAVRKNKDVLNLALQELEECNYIKNISINGKQYIEKNPTL
ncbi:DUF3987 domain-containing protein [Acinetobacter sp. WCHAc060007]|uniref:DUF3987 domain-containing protein n=1 Tax=Acinetobacter sp. WCHAc060007 TaxID=2419605 RepID=UPI000EA0491C|nr:DUF3987 domain-containing protein [Acinetobacter sp. WCHAc060007]RKG40719.1 DUF3987 domain-containing protein [Acinetobacter sp. WCHAc060007]